MGINKKELMKILSQYKEKTGKPLTIEVFGTPNSGKTTAIQFIERILNRYRIKNTIIYEAASHCPIKDKLSPEFNIWTMSESIKGLMSAKSIDNDIIICERGIYDSLCWFEMYYQERKIKKRELEKLRNYILMDRISGSIDCCFIMECSVETSLKRENPGNASDFEGRIVNTKVLNAYNNALNLCKESYAQAYKQCVCLDTSDIQQQDINNKFLGIIQELIG